VTAVGVLGIGRMGGAMARALAGAGFDVVLWNRTGVAADRLATELGGRSVARPRDVATSADICVTMLADRAAVDAVYGGADGLLAGARPGNVLVDASTVSPATLRDHEPAARAAGASLLDAPVSGSVVLAERGQLTLMVGGAVDDLERARPVLDAMAQAVFHLGPLGSGAAMKLAVNTVIFGLNQALAEGLVLAEAAGIDRATAYDVMAASAAGAPYVGYKRASFLEPETTPIGFALELAEKDLLLISELAASVGLSLPQVAADLASVRSAAGALGPAVDFSAVASHLRGSATERKGVSA
jgi:3-hydroxyisobutyrate dehydrogenase-like beta-hydroxyacid dehydrogenase